MKHATAAKVIAALSLASQAIISVEAGCDFNIPESVSSVSSVYIESKRYSTRRFVYTVIKSHHQLVAFSALLCTLTFVHHSLMYVHYITSLLCSPFYFSQIDSPLSNPLLWYCVHSYLFITDCKCIILWFHCEHLFISQVLTPTLTLCCIIVHTHICSSQRQVSALYYFLVISLFCYSHVDFYLQPSAIDIAYTNILFVHYSVM